MMRSIRDAERSQPATSPSPNTLLFAFGGLMASLAAGYGVLFTIVADMRDQYGLSERWVGIIIGTGFIAGFLAQVTIAPLADRGHARKVVLIGVAVNVVGLLLMAAGTTLIPILIGRFISGIGIGTASPAVKRIVVLADPDNLGQNMGRLLAADVFGFASGPVVSALTAERFGLSAPFIIVAAATAVLLPFVARVKVDEATEAPSQRLAFDLLKNRPFAGAVVFGAVTFVMIGSFDALWDVVHEDLGTRDWIANLGITLFGLPLIVLASPGGRLAQTFGPFRLGAIGLLIATGFMFSYGFITAGGIIFAVAMFHALSDGLTISASGVAVGMVVPEGRQAGAHGVIGAAQAISAGIMAPVTSELYGRFGQQTAYTVAAVVMLVMIGIGVWLARSAWSITRPLGSTTNTSLVSGR